MPGAMSEKIKIHRQRQGQGGYSDGIDARHAANGILLQCMLFLLRDVGDHIAGQDKKDRDGHASQSRLDIGRRR